MSENNNNRNNLNDPDLDIINYRNNGSGNEQNTMVNFIKLNKIMNSNNFSQNVCKIEISNKITKTYASGFFCHIQSKELRVLISNNHVINEQFLKNVKELTIYLTDNNEEIKKIINLDSERLKYTNEALDITIIEILDEDLIDSFFEIDENFIKNKKFLNETVFNLQYPQGGNLNISFGKILQTYKENKFLYDAGSDSGSSGSPIILFEDFTVIGIHKGVKKNKNDFRLKINKGIYLDKIINLIPKSTRPENKNIIGCTYDIKKEDINKDIQVYNNINNIERYIKSVSIYRQDEKKRRINNGMYKFDKEGKYFIFYEFDKTVNDLSHIFNNCSTLTRVNMPTFNDSDITNMSYMFNKCISLKRIDFLNSFNTKNVANMSDMFRGCISLENINLSSFNTENVKKMSGLFRGCSSLKKIDLSSFNTKNALDLSYMFKGCKKLLNINLSSFNTEKVTDMSHMFDKCQQLEEINLNTFNTQNNRNFSYMFENCNSIKKLDLSSFNTINNINMKNMFNNCNNLKEINLSTFKTNNMAITENMFLGCSSLEILDSCTDKKIIEEFNLNK